MTPHEFEQLAQERMEEYLGVSLKKKAPNGFPKIFDLVSDDESVVGDAKYLTLVAGKYDPPAKLMEITGHVWLLEKVQARRRFLVFRPLVNAAAVPEDNDVPAELAEHGAQEQGGRGGAGALDGAAHPQFRAAISRIPTDWPRAT